MFHSKGLSIDYFVTAIFLHWFFDNVARIKVHTINLKSSTQRGWRYIILHDKNHCGRGWLLAGEQRGILGQHVVNMILSVSGLGSARINHSAEFCIFGLNKNPRITLQKHLSYFQEYINSYQPHKTSYFMPPKQNTPHPWPTVYMQWLFSDNKTPFNLVISQTQAFKTKNRISLKISDLVPLESTLVYQQQWDYNEQQIYNAYLCDCVNDTANTRYQNMVGLNWETWCDHKSMGHSLLTITPYNRKSGQHSLQ